MTWCLDFCCLFWPFTKALRKQRPKQTLAVTWNPNGSERSSTKVQKNPDHKRELPPLMLQQEATAMSSTFSHEDESAGFFGPLWSSLRWKSKKRPHEVQRTRSERSSGAQRKSNASGDSEGLSANAVQCSRRRKVAHNGQMLQSVRAERPARVPRSARTTSKSAAGFSSGSSVKLEPLLEEEANKGQPNMKPCTYHDETKALTHLSDSDSGIVTMMEDENDENANKAKIKLKPWSSTSSTPARSRTVSTASSTSTTFNEDTLAPAPTSRSITMIKHCRPLFGIVKHHVCSRFELRAEEDLQQQSQEEEELEIDPFTSLPPTMSFGSTLNIHSIMAFNATRPNFEGYSIEAPMSMPSSPFRSFADRTKKSRPELARLRQTSLMFKAQSEKDISIANQVGPAESHQKRCREHNWQSRVWIQAENVTVQLCHVCKTSCQRNYRSNDLSKHFAARRPKLAKATSNANSAAIIWYRYFARQVEADLTSAQGHREVEALLLKQRLLSQKVCARCGEGFSLLFNRRLECIDCNLGACRKCCVWINKSAQDKATGWRCQACQNERLFRRQSCDWFYTQVQSKFHNFGSAKVVKTVGFSKSDDEGMAEVRDHIEKVVETLVSDNLDEASVVRLADHPSYERVFLLFHKNLSDALTQLAQAIYAVLSHHPLENEKTPTEAHSGLKNLIDALLEEVQEDEAFQELELSPSIIKEKTKHNESLFLAETYEDLLSTAIINKLVIGCQHSKHKTEGKSLRLSTGEEESGRFSYNEDDFEDKMSPKRPDSTNQGSSSGHSSGTRQTDSAGSQMSDSSFSASSPHQQGPPTADSAFADIESDEDAHQVHQYLVEEEVEEVTEEFFSGDDEAKPTSTTTSRSFTKNGPWLSTHPSLHSLDFILAEMNPEQDEKSQKKMKATNSKPVPFPEFGVDIVVVHHKNEMEFSSSSSSSSSTSSSSSSDESDEIKWYDDDDESRIRKPREDKQSALLCHQSVEDWEENWLFRRKRSQESGGGSLSLTMLTNDPVAMLVPLPNEGAKTFIGEKDVDEVSELSVASCSSGSSVSSEASTENDLEHTEYSVTPLIRSSVSISRGSRTAREMIQTLANEGCPVFVIAPEAKTTSHLGKTVTFEAVTAGAKPIDVAWFRGPSLLEDDGEAVEILRIRDRHILRLYDVQKSGIYSCTALNSAGEVTHHFSLNVKKREEECPLEAPSIDMDEEVDIFVSEGEAITMVCRVGGRPEPRLVFYKDEKRLRPNENISIERQEDGLRWVLQIRNFGPRQVGKYCALAKSRSGTCTRTWNLHLDPTSEEVTNNEDVVSGSEEATHSKDYEELDENDMPLYPQSILKKPSEFPPVPFNVLEEAHEEEDNDNESLDIILPSDRDVVDDFGDFDRPITKPGTIADREHRKWIEKAVPLQHNPYSRESLEKRLSRASVDSGTSTLQSSVLADSNGRDLLMLDESQSNRIDCGPKLSNLRRYWRDYYVDPSRSSASSSVSDENGGESPDCLKKSPDSTGGAFKGRMDSSRMDEASDSDGLHDSLDDTNVQDSGVGSSSERQHHVPKTSSKVVAAEIEKFQKEIERANNEKSKVIEWRDKKKAARRSASSDSLLSMDENSDCSSTVAGPRGPLLPPKGRFISTDNLSSNSPPALPPKRLPPSATKANLNKRVSISTTAVHIINSDTDCLTDGSVKERIKSFMQHQPLQPEKANKEEVLFDKNGKKIEDLPEELPSVRNLASMFNPRKSPEPLPRNSLSNKKPDERPKEFVKPSKVNGHQIHCHSLTARSVPRQFREDLRKGKGESIDRNIRLQSTTSGHPATAPDIHIIYDSENRDIVPYPFAEVIRTPSPEHVGIPAGPVKMPPIRSWQSSQKSGSPVGYTSDESCYSDHKHPMVKPTRRKLTKQSSNPSVKSLVEKYNV